MPSTDHPVPPNPSINRFLEQYVLRHPVHATAMGIRLHDHELPDWSREAREDELDEFEALTVAIDDEHTAAEDPTALLGDPALIDAAHARASMDARQLALESGYFADSNPALWIREALTGLHVIAREQRGSDTDDMASLAMRLHDVPRFLEALPATVAGPIPAAWREAAQAAVREALAIEDSIIGPWLRSHTAPPDTESWLREAATTAMAAFHEADQWLDGVPVHDDAPTMGAEAYETLLRSMHLLAEPLALLRERLLQQDEARWLDADSYADEEEPLADLPWPLPWLRTPLDVPTTDDRVPDPAIIPDGATLLGRLAGRDAQLTIDALPGSYALDAWQAHAGPAAWRAMLTATAAIELRLHCDALATEDAIDRLQAEGGPCADPARAASVVEALRMHPGRALAAWHGALLFDQLHGVLSAQHGATLSPTAFASQVFQWGAIPVSLIARLLLGTK